MPTNHSLEKADVFGKYVFLRCSYDVPLDSGKSILDSRRVRDDSRIKDTIPTLSYLVRNNAKIILAGGWLGRPKGEDPDLTMAPIALRIQELLTEEGALKHPLLLTPNCLDGSKPRSAYRNQEEVIAAAKSLKEGQVLLLENVRFDPEANSNDQRFAEFMATLVGNNAVYVNEAEAQNHRLEATITSVPRIICERGGSTAFGLKYQDAITYIGNIAHLLEKKERGPFIFFLSGKKIETQVGITSKISVTHSLLDKMRKGDVLIVQGAVTYTFHIAEKYLEAIDQKMDEVEKTIGSYNKKIKSESGQLKKEGKEAQAIVDNEAKLQREKSERLKEIIGLTDQGIRRQIGNSFVEWKEIGEQVAFAARVYFKARERGVIVLTNADHTITDKFPDKYGNLPPDAQISSFGSPNEIPQGWLGVAPGTKTAATISDHAQKASLIILAGPLSIEDERVEESSQANKIVLGAIRKAKFNGAITIGAGGDTAATIRKWNAEDAFTVISNAGGATLELIEKGTLPGIEAVKACGN